MRCGVLSLPAGSWWDWELLSLDRDVLTLAAGPDLTYHHDLEVVFRDVSYLACPTFFQDPVFRAPTAEERRRAPDAVVVAFDHDEATRPGLIAAASVEVVPGLVYRYHRDDPAPGARFATWVRGQP